MFYCHEILQKKKGLFGIVWTAATRRNLLSMRDYMSVSVPKTCEDITACILKQKIVDLGAGIKMKPILSLYLSSQLMYGICVVYQKQVDNFFSGACSFKFTVCQAVAAGRKSKNVGNSLDLSPRELERSRRMVTTSDLLQNIHPEMGFIDIDLEAVNLQDIHPQPVWTARQQDLELSDEHLLGQSLIPQGLEFPPFFSGPDVNQSPIASITMRESLQGALAALVGDDIFGFGGMGDLMIPTTEELLATDAVLNIDSILPGQEQTVIGPQVGPDGTRVGEEDGGSLYKRPAKLPRLRSSSEGGEGANGRAVRKKLKIDESVTDSRDVELQRDVQSISVDRQELSGSLVTSADPSLNLSTSIQLRSLSASITDPQSLGRATGGSLGRDDLQDMTIIAGDAQMTALPTISEGLPHDLSAGLDESAIRPATAAGPAATPAEVEPVGKKAGEKKKKGKKQKMGLIVDEKKQIEKLMMRKQMKTTRNLLTDLIIVRPFSPDFGDLSKMLCRPGMCRALLQIFSNGTFTHKEAAVSQSELNSRIREMFREDTAAPPLMLNESEILAPPPDAAADIPAGGLADEQRAGVQSERSTSLPPSEIQRLQISSDISTEVNVTGVSLPEFSGGEMVRSSSLTDISRTDPSLLIQQQTQLQGVPELDENDPGAMNQLDLIKWIQERLDETRGSGGLTFDILCPPGTYRKHAVRVFYAVLDGVKKRLWKVSQSKSYSTIKIFV